MDGRLSEIRIINQTNKNSNMKLRNTALLLGMAALIIAIMSSCNQAPAKKSTNSGTVYYRSLQFSETPYDLERGVRELTAEEAADINSYKFVYDDMGKLLSVEFVRVKNHWGIPLWAGPQKLPTTYSDNKQVKHFFDENGQQIKSGGAYTFEYTLDEKGNRTGLKFFDKDGQPVENRNKIHSWVWTILDNGMVQENRYNLANEETIMNQFCPFYELRFTYNDKGYVTRMANYMGDTLYNCTAENCGDIGVSYFDFEPNEFGDNLASRYLMLQDKCQIFTGVGPEESANLMRTGTLWKLQSLIRTMNMSAVKAYL